jgi:hypothetical protein
MLERMINSWREGHAGVQTSGTNPPLIDEEGERV